MKKLYLFALTALLSLYTPLVAMAQTWSWAQSAGSNGHDHSNAVAVDKDGNAYIAGDYQGDSITFGATTFYPGTYSSDVFIAKYSAAGAVLWCKEIKGTHFEKGTALATDTGGNVYIAGVYRSDTLRIGSAIFINTAVAPYYSSQSDIFIAKFSPSGTLLWAKSIGSFYDDNVNGICVDAAGDIYITGGYGGTSISFGSTVFSNPSSYTTDVFLAKYSSSGAPLWARNMTGWSMDAGGAVLTNRYGDVFVTGSFSSDTLWAGTTALVNDSAEAKDIFIAAYNSSGTMLWAKRVGNSSDDEGMKLATDSTGDIYVAGQFKSDTLIFGTDTLLNVIPNNMFYDIFLAKYSTTGVPLWARRAGSYYHDLLGSIVVDSSSYVYLTGDYNTSGAPMTFDAVTLPTWLSYASGYFAKYTPAGTALLARQVPIGLPYMAMDSANNMYFTGLIGGPTFFDAILVPHVSFFDVAVAKTYDTCTPPVLPPITGATVVCTGTTITLANAVPGGTWSVSSGASITTSGVVTGLTPGMAVVSYLMVRPCGSLYAVVHNIVINPSPDAGAISGSASTCVGLTIPLSVSATGGSWSTSDPEVSVSSTGNVTGLATGTGLVSYTVTNSCGTQSSLKLITVYPAAACEPTGIAAMAVADELIIFPNPAQHQFTIQLPEGTAAADIIVTDMPGRILKQIQNTGGVQQTVTCADLPAGACMVEVHSAAGTWRSKVIISK